MNDESQMSDYSHHSFVQAVKPQSYDFVSYSQRTPDEKESKVKYKQKTHQDFFLENSFWKPRLPSKKLFQEPKFLLSLERKKIRVIAGLNSSQLEAMEPKRNSFRSEKVRILTQRINTSKTEKNTKQSQKIPTKEESESRKNKTFRNPHLNFNLQYLIKKRKTRVAESDEKKKGSNAPYLSFFTSTRFQIPSARAPKTKYSELEKDKNDRKIHSKTAQPIFRSQIKKL